MIKELLLKQAKPKLTPKERLRIPNSNIMAPPLHPLVNGRFDILKRQLIENIKLQAEFYFGDPNLSKDKKLQEMIKLNKKGYISVDSLLEFSKIKGFFIDASISSLFERKNLLIEALKKSELLKLCKDLTLVKRISPFDFELLANKEYIDEVNNRMVYVENLPSFTKIETLANIFSKKGNVLHISLPKFKRTEIKGFAFLEFSVSMNY